jgi:hypothetical protein
MSYSIVDSYRYLFDKVFLKMSNIGPSGKEKLHFKQCKGPADAKNQARAHSPGSSNSGGHVPITHQAHKEGQQAHKHPTDAKGEKMQDGSHFLYGKKK